MFLSPPLSHSIEDSSTFEEHLHQLNFLPEEVLEFKREAWERYHSLPVPGPKSEHWRFSRAPAIHDFGLAPADASHSNFRTILESKLAGAPIRASDLIFFNNHCIQEPEISEELKAQGVIFCSLAKALQNYPDFLLRYLSRAGSSLGGDKYLALTLAYCSSGYFLQVPEGLSIAEPFGIYYLLSGHNSATFPISIALGEGQSHFKLRDVYLSAEYESASLVSAYSLVKAMPQSQVSRTILQNLSSKSLYHHIDRNFLGEEADFKSFNLNLGGSFARNESHLKLMGEHCKGELYGLGLAAAKQIIDTRTLQVHGAAQSYSNLLYKNVLLDEARTIFSGLIKVEPDAQGVDAYQTNRNLILSEDAQANALPGLEILANEVKCSHGATSSELDPEQVYYLMSRGISRQQAESLLILSFLEDILSNNQDADAQAIARDYLQDKLNAVYNHDI